MALRSYAIVGTGAVGGYYGGLLARRGHSVHFLCHSDYATIRRRGLRVESVNGDFRLPHAAAYRRASDMPVCDVVVVALKTVANHLLADLLPPMVGPESVVLMLQNGLGNEEAAAKVVGPDRLLGGLCFLCSNKVGPGHIRHLDYGDVLLGAHAAADKPAHRRRRQRPAPSARTSPSVGHALRGRLQEVADDLRAAGVTVDITDDLVLGRWKKLVWNIPYNGLSVVLGATTDRIMADAHSRAMVEALMDEVVLSARACGKTIDPGFVRSRIEHTERMRPYQTSMKLDYDAGRPMEVEAIFGNPVRAARQAGYVPLRIEMLHHTLAHLDARHRAVQPRRKRAM